MLQIPSIRNSSINTSGGFTLIEVLVAIVIIMIGMLGLLETINVGMQHNLKNQLRGEGVRVGERFMAELRGKAFSAYSDSYTTVSYNSQVRGVSKTFKVLRTAQPVGLDAAGQPSSRQLKVTVMWSFRNQSSLNQVVSVVAKP